MPTTILNFAKIWVNMMKNLTGKLAVSAFLSTSILLTHSSYAKTDNQQYKVSPAIASDQVAGFYRQALGDFQITALYDGDAKLPLRQYFQGQSTEKMSTLLKGYYIDPSKAIQTSVNAFLINTGKELILVDSGAAKCFGEGLGSIEKNLNAAGYRVEQVDKILLTHLHPDHVCGISPIAGQKAFPNATVYVDQTEADFWLNPVNLNQFPKEKQANFKSVFDQTAKIIQPYQASKQFKTFKIGDQIAEGINIVPTHGHTIGHSSFLVSSKNQKMLILGDVVHSHALQFEQPEISFTADFDAKQAIQTRLALFKTFAQNGDFIAAAHLPFPGVGHIRETSPNHYQWIPVQYNPQVLPTDQVNKTAK